LLLILTNLCKKTIGVIIFFERMPETKTDIISRLRKEILMQEGFKPLLADANGVICLQAIEAAFPNGVFPTGAMHEFLSDGPEQGAASGGFISGILAALMKKGGTCVWIGMARTVFPPALKTFGVEPDKIIFIDLRREKDVLWVMEEALKCEGLAAVVGEVRELTFMQSRRLQLAVETSKVTGFVLRNDMRKVSTTACIARWQIQPIPSELEAGMPGVGLPRWQIDLLKVRNGKPGSWKVEWAGDRFALVTENNITFNLPGQIQKVG
jgi:protein ImuA